MGCGCGKNRNNRAARATAAKKKAQAERMASTSEYRKKKAERRKVMGVKIRFCKDCSHQSPTPAERRSKTRNCHKSNLSLQAIFNDKNFKCPIGNF